MSFSRSQTSLKESFKKYKLGAKKRDRYYLLTLTPEDEKKTESVSASKSYSVDGGIWKEYQGKKDGLFSSSRVYNPYHNA